MQEKKRLIILMLLSLMLLLGGTIPSAAVTVHADETEAADAVKTGYVYKNGSWYYYNSSGKLVKGWYTSKSGTIYYFGTTGAAKAGILTIDKKKYCFNAKGKMLTKWQTISGKTYFFDQTDGHMHTGWTVTSAGNKYYFFSDGVIRSGWQKVGSKYYYFNSLGKMLTNVFKTNGNSTYYLNSKGIKQTGRYEIKGHWYAFNRNNGKLVRSGWYKETDGTYYYAAANGKLVSGFYKPDSYYRYFRASDCQMLTGWQEIDGARYYFKTTNGIRYENRKVTAASGKMYYFNSDGKLYVSQWFSKSGNHYYAQDNGVLATGWLTYKDNTYYMNKKSGIRMTGWITDSDKEYYLSPSTGILARDQWIDGYYVGSDGAKQETKGGFRWPLSSSYTYISSYFGNRESPGGIGSTNHQGIDIPAPTGTPIYAAAAGTVSLKQTTANSGGAGNYTVIDHGDGLKTEYMHQSKFAENLKVGTTVTKGQIIGYVGSTGNSTGAHLHFGVYDNGVRHDPLNYVKQPS